MSSTVKKWLEQNRAASETVGFEAFDEDGFNAALEAFDVEMAQLNQEDRAIQTATAALETYEESLTRSLNRGGIAPESISILDASMSLNGLGSLNVAVEDFKDEHKRADATAVALESLKETIGAWGRKSKDFIIKLFQKIMEWLGRFVNFLASFVDTAKKMKRQLAGIKNQVIPPDWKVQFSDHALISVDGDVWVGKNHPGVCTAVFIRDGRDTLIDRLAEVVKNGGKVDSTSFIRKLEASLSGRSIFGDKKIEANLLGEKGSKLGVSIVDGPKKYTGDSKTFDVIDLRDLKSAVDDLCESRIGAFQKVKMEMEKTSNAIKAVIATHKAFEEENSNPFGGASNETHATMARTVGILQTNEAVLQVIRASGPGLRAYTELCVRMTKEHVKAANKKAGSSKADDEPVSGQRALPSPT